MNPKEGRTAVDSLRGAGADFIKVYQRLDRDTYFAIADEAKRQGVPFAGHLPQAITLDEAGRSGQRSIEHLTLGNSSGLLPLCSSQEDALRRGAEEQFRLAVASSPNDPTVLPPRREWMKLAVESFDEERCLKELRRLAAHGTWHTPTLMAGMLRGVHDDSILKDSRLDYATPGFRSQWETARQRYVSAFSETESAAFFRLLLRIVSILQRASVGLLAGTDAPVASAFAVPGFSLHQELELLVRAGLTPIEALRTATLQPARYFGMEDAIGTVERGKLADLVLLSANPLEDIRHTQRIEAVVANGRYFDRTALETRYWQKPKRAPSHVCRSHVRRRLIVASARRKARSFMPPCPHLTVFSKPPYAALLRLRFGASSWSVGSISGKSGPPTSAIYSGMLPA
jgi:hypothetical protein